MSARGLLGAGAFSAAILVSGCGGSAWVDSVRTGPPRPARPDDAPVRIYFNENPAAPWAEVGQIRVRTKGSGATVDAVLAAATSEAQKLGADAIIVDFRHDYQSVEVTLDCEGKPHVAPSPRLNARVIAVRFVAAGEAAPEAPPFGPPPIRACAGGGDR